MLARVAALVCLLVPGGALQITSSRRAVITGLAALTPLTPQLANAEVCLGKCAEDPAKVAARKAIQEQAGNKPYAFRLEPSQCRMACSSLPRLEPSPCRWAVPVRAVSSGP